MFKYHSAILKNVSISSYAQQSLKIELRVVVGTTLKLNMFLNHAWNFAGNLAKTYDSVYDMCHEPLCPKDRRVIINKIVLNEIVINVG
jgi:hypothetical protein